MIGSFIVIKFILFYLLAPRKLHFRPALLKFSALCHLMRGGRQ